ncbi:hypothetical protein RhiirC2_785318 [Rhizophagus irregularis]|uniref:Uncharacterized protein n=1 Tax=Rhizophagus irregularis TaxID=588596 RepID=A0A2N1MWQ7_9GLOM|nr:hypothetical protein RhiirC2_785318 [Rhizophagus irregularis]
MDDLGEGFDEMSLLQSFSLPICGAGKIKITLPIPISLDMNTLEWYYGIVNSLNKVSCMGHIATLIDDFYSLLLAASIQ